MNTELEFEQVSAEGYEPIQIPFQVMGDEATSLNITLRRLAVSLSSPSSSFLSVSVSSLVEDPTLSMTPPTNSSFPDESSGDGIQSTLHPLSIESDYNSTLMTTVETTKIPSSIYPSRSNHDDIDDDGDDEECSPLCNKTALPRMDAVVSGATWTFGGGSPKMPSSIWLISCTFVCLTLTLQG